MQNRLIVEPIQHTPNVKEERTFWRDLKLCKRHKDWGWDVPAVDIDFLEYDERKAVALFEYKLRADIVVGQIVSDANLAALTDLANRAGIPLFVVFYNTTYQWFRVLGANALGMRHYQDSGAITEYAFVSFLYWLRGREMPDNVKVLLFGGGY